MCIRGSSHIHEGRNYARSHILVVDPPASSAYTERGMDIKTLVLILFIFEANILTAETRVSATEKPFGDQTGDIQFIVMSDRTGGMRPGVFRDAVTQVNLLHPQFVISVGDLIDGYTEDETLLRNQWEEFNGILESLDVPFYYVPGNHDISNPWMETWWKEKLGSPYYHFLYKGTLFIVLHTEDQGRMGIQPDQIEYVKQVLLENPAPRWTFVFMHRPLWFHGQSQGYEPIDEALQGRRYTLFSGHHHTYYSDERDGNKRYILATTGGSSGLRGADVGEFDHITHVTLTEHGPKIVNLRLDGFVRDDIVNEANYAMVETLRQGSFFTLEPSIAASDTAEHITTHIQLRNPTESILQIKGKLESPVSGWKITPASIDLSLNPNEDQSLLLTLTKADANAIPLHALDTPLITLTGAYPSGGRTISLPSNKSWTIDWNRPLSSTGTDVSIDGVFNDSPALAWIPFTPAEYIKEDWDYRGDEDLNGRFSLSESTTHLFIRWELVDNIWLMDHPIHRDQWEVWLQREPGGNVIHLRMQASEPSDQTLTISNGPPGIVAFARFEGNTMRCEISVPKSSLQIDESTTGIRFNLAVMDHDRKENTKPSVLFWKPPWDSNSAYEGSGVFMREQQTRENN